MPEHRLAAAYRTARYCIRVADGRWIERRIGVMNPAADRALAFAGCRAHWHIVTPCNPGSVALSKDDNDRRLVELRDHLHAAGWRHLPSESRAADGSWPEAGCCLLDVEHHRVAALAAQFGQLAFVAGQLGSAPDLVWLPAS